MRTTDRFGRKFGLWMFGAFLAFHLVFAAFIRVAPWPFAIPPQRASLRWPGEIDPSWRAVVSNHGRPQEWPPGTVSDNPAEFAVWVATMVAGAIGLRHCGRQLKRIADEPG